MNKRGLSQVITIILLTLLVLAAIGVVWVAVRGLLTNGANSISLGKLSVDMAIKSASYNSSTTLATVKVVRNPGISKVNVTGIKFIVADSKGTDVFEVNVPGGFPVLATRTYTLNISKSKYLNPNEIQSITIAPLYITASGTVEIATSGENTFIFNDSASKSTITVQCTTNSDCGTDTFVSGAYSCNATTNQVMQSEKIYQCYTPYGICQNSLQAKPIKNCTSTQFCSASSGTCISKLTPCTPQNVSTACGVSGFYNSESCNTQQTAIVQQYDNYSCINGFCQENITQNAMVQNCSAAGQVCGTSAGSPECFTPLQCTTNSDCSFGKVCVQGNCTQEYASLNGTVDAPWPPGRNEYFQSSNLPKVQNSSSPNYIGYTIIFPGSKQTSCLTITNYVYPSSTNYDAYVKLNATLTNISTGDQFQLWQTSYGCTKI